MRIKNFWEFINFILKKRRERKHKKLRAFLLNLKNYFEFHKKFIMLLKEINLDFEKDINFEEIITIVNEYKMKIESIRKEVKILKNLKKYEKTYKELDSLLNLHELQIYFFKRFLHSLQKNDIQMANYYKSVLNELFSKDLKKAEKFVKNIENIKKVL